MDENTVPATLPGAFPAAPFEEHRPHLRAVAYRLLGTFEEADEAVEDVRRTWPARLPPIAPGPVPVPALYDPTEAVARACLDRLRSRETHREHPWDPWDPWASGQPDHRSDPEEPPPPTALDGLTPPERLAFVLHDEFSVPYERIAPILERTPAAARQLAGRARYRLREAEEMPAPDLPRQRDVVAAFLAAARSGDAAAAHELLDPDVVLRTDATAERTGATAAHGPGAVAEAIARQVSTARKALVDGAAGLAWPAEGDPRLVFAFTVLEDRITAIDALSDADHLGRLKLQL
ncbi:sigma factor-like helix-turn-helix DNA-binding protein [Streptomyces sp. NBC_00233]|uniref:sigma factor-like helix-turn-helix DNA-binding protein n=1 Tax=Streptomyces sp. NBC_00233 TaxID=2975686 RepID=UPI00224EE4E3|nr:sigma factor-like helix-turn-helix DNA-binding protein [Streptomyces sp. NBC_00233]MCX5227038.1 RNA polymerase subunit sigma-70 [Streptomyces sp. NBC_00233]